jgi:hypothetical protein
MGSQGEEGLQEKGFGIGTESAANVRFEAGLPAFRECSGQEVPVFPDANTCILPRGVNEL